MSLDDLARDGEAEAGILAKTFDRTVGVEALEDALQRVRRDAGAVVLDFDDDSLGGRRIGVDVAVALPAQANADLPSGFRERAGVVDEVRDHLGEPGIVAEHGENLRGAAPVDVRP